MITPDLAEFNVRFDHFSVKIGPGSDQQAVFFGKNPKRFLLTWIMVGRINLQAFQAALDQLPDILFAGVGRMGQDRDSSQVLNLADGGEGEDVFHLHKGGFSSPQVITVEIDIRGTGPIAVDIRLETRVPPILFAAEDGLEKRHPRRYAAVGELTQILPCKEKAQFVELFQPLFSLLFLFLMNTFQPALQTVVLGVDEKGEEMEVEAVVKRVEFHAGNEFNAEFSGQAQPFPDIVHGVVVGKGDGPKANLTSHH